MICVESWVNRWEHLLSQPLLLACSGGVDSMVLLFLLKQGNFQVEIAHVNYHLRGEASELDERLVREQADKYGFSIHVKSVRLKDKLQNGGNLQAKARKERFDFFKEISADKPIKLVLGHHADDQLETFWLMLTRGAGMQGLSGMQEESETIIRPLLPYSKNEIYAFARANHLIWREDESNQQLAYQRNRWRNAFFPVLDARMSSWREAVFILQKQFQNEQIEREKRLKPFHQKLVKNTFLSDSEVLNWQLEDILMLFNWLDFPLRKADEWENFIQGEKGKQLHSEMGILTREKGGISYWKREEAIVPYLKIQEVNQLPNRFTKDEIFLDRSKIQGQLTIRKWQEGDRIFSIGIQGSKKVSSVLKELQVHFPKKQQTWVVCDEKHIHWVVGMQVGRKAIAQSDSKQIIKLNIEEKHNK